MSPNLENKPVQSTIGIKNSKHRDTANKNMEDWFLLKSTTDEAEGLWRVYDSIYDLTDFVDRHPGGKFWLEMTKGTDITEAFESHHNSIKAETTLKKHLIREAKTPRNSPYTFKEDGFYKTLKRAVREELEKLPKDLHKPSETIIDCLLASVFIVAILANIYSSYMLGVITGVLGGLLVIAGHNYIHQRDTFRMYYMDVVGGQSSAFRIVHVLSHHLYTNTVADIQAYAFEPLLIYLPQKKTWITKYASILYAPLLIWPTSILAGFILRWVAIIRGVSKLKPNIADVVPLLLPTVMYLLAGRSLLTTLLMWVVIEAIAGFTFGVIAFTMGHFHPDIFVDGDTPRPKHEMDWGIAQLDTVADRCDAMGSHVLSLLCFGDHAVHHLFPTLDVGVIQKLYPVIERVMNDFNLKIRWVNMLRMYRGYLRRMAKEVPNTNPPNLHKVLQ